MQIRTSRADVIWSYAGTIVSSVSGFLLLPFLIYYLSGAELGLWYVYQAVGNLVMLFEFGFSPTFSRNFTFCWSGARELTREGCVREEGERDADPELMAHLIGACKLVYRRVALVGLAVLAMPGTLYVLSVTGGLDRSEVLVSWAIFASGVLLNLYFLWYASALRGIGAVAEDSQVMIAARLTQLVATAILLFLGCGLVGAAIGFFLNALMYRIVGSHKFWHARGVPELGLRSIKIDGERVQQLYKMVSYNAFKDGWVMISNYASTQASSLICSSFLGLEEAGTFSIALQFANAIGNMAQVYWTSCTPMLQSAYQRGDRPLVRRTLGLCAAVYVVVSAVLFAGVLVVIYPLLNVFKPGSNFDPLVYCGVTLYMFLFNWCALFASMLANMNTIPYVRAYVVTATAVIVLSAALTNVPGLGVWGLILGLAVPQCAYNVWKWPGETAKRLDSSPMRLLSEGSRALAEKAKSLVSGRRRESK